MSACRRRSFVLVLAAGLLCALGPALRAQIPGLEWSDPEVVDPGVLDVSATSGPVAAHAPAWLPWGQGEWHVVYAKDGQIYRRVRTGSGWLAPERVSGDGAIARDPHVGFGGGYLHVVWEDVRSGHAEVYDRRWSDAGWAPEECLTCDATASAQPVVAGVQASALVAWEESTGSGGAILAREWDGSQWGAPQAISESPGAATQPTIAAESAFMGMCSVAWSDTRHGAPEIYLRSGYDGGWYPEVRLTDLPGNCGRPSISIEICCGDWINPQSLVLFEYDGSGTVETYEACYDQVQGPYVEQLSTEDGIPSTAPSACGFTFMAESCALWGGGPSSLFFGCWTDAAVPHVGHHPVRAFQMCYPRPESDLLPATGYGKAALACIEGEPLAGLLALWVEMRADVPTLMARRGSTAGCFREELEPPRVILLAPGGYPENVVHVVDTCTGSPVSQQWVGLSFSPELDAALTWDAEQPHPDLPAVATGSDGNAYFPIRGGGCSPDGFVRAWCVMPDYFPEGVVGAKSPDVDGDCQVDGNDMLYVRSMLGTDDFCADLDASGVVDGADVMIVQYTLGDHCSGLPSDVAPLDDAANAGDDRGPDVALLSNPCHDAAAIRCTLSAPARLSARVLDAAGALVRDLGERDLPAGPTAIVWDTRDAGGRRVASGIYFLALHGARWDVRRSVLVVR